MNKLQEISNVCDVDLSDLKDISIELIDLTNINILENKESTSVTLKTNSTCSSRTSYTNDEDELDNNSVCDNNEYEDGEFGSANNTTLLGGPGTPIQDTGISYYPQQAVAVQLTGMNTGR